MFSFGIEHEVAFLNAEGQYVDFQSTAFHELNAIVERLPLYDGDYPQLRIGDAGIKHKRWYIEGYERYNFDGKVTDCPPKGIEIRTTIHSTIQGAVAELTESFRMLAQEARACGFFPVLISFHPYCTEYVPDPPLNEFERDRKRQSPEKRTAVIPMLTHGPDLNLSCPDFSSEQLIDVGRKLTYYSPWIIPFSFSSPFYGGKLWDGLSARTFVRTGPRPAVMIFMAERGDLISSNPSLTKIARLPSEVGRIEFKACDSCADFSLYAALMALLKGLILDNTLHERLTTPDAHMHQLSAREGFAHPEIEEGAHRLLLASEQALDGDPDTCLLTPLRGMLKARTSPAHDLIKQFQATGSIEAALRSTYTS